MTERVSFVPPSDLIESLPAASMTVSGFFNADASLPYYREMQGKPVRVMVQVPRSQWQAFKANHDDAWWLRWLVGRWPVRTKTTRTFTGHIETVDDGEVSIAGDPAA